MPQQDTKAARRVINPRDPEAQLFEDNLIDRCTVVVTENAVGLMDEMEKMRVQMGLMFKLIADLRKDVDAHSAAPREQAVGR